MSGSIKSEFPITIGFNQQSPYLFALVMGEFTRLVEDEFTWCMFFVDYIVLVDETRHQVNTKFPTKNNSQHQVENLDGCFRM